MSSISELSCAIKAAKSCETIISTSFRKSMAYEKKSAQEVVTKVDFACENVIKKILKKSFPDYGFVGEETSPELLENGCFWIVDPIDGTTNFLHGLPCFVVSICLIKNNEPVIGVIFDPIHGELFSTEKGKGAFLNKTNAFVSKTPDLADCIIQFNSAYNHRSEAGALIQKFGDKVRDPQMGRSTALQMADICCGRSDAFIKIEAKIFDLLAGILLIKEAGGKITTFEGKEFKLFKDKNIVASNGKIHEALLNELK
ncbi:MAG: inositol monophosphatase family protein [Candidatus ainarchaeum sp.]|nr:inositol monophosphatase family protein [Candidatus ainarchaeum sp.]